MPPRYRTRRSTTRWGIAIALLLGLGGMQGPGMVSGQPVNEGAPEFQIARFTCEDDLQIGDSLGQRCSSTSDRIELSGEDYSESLDIDGDEPVRLQTLPDGDYTLTSMESEADRISLVECHENGSYGDRLRYPAIPVEYVDDATTISISLRSPDDRSFKSTFCRWYDLPSDLPSIEELGRPAGVVVYSQRSLNNGFAGTPRELVLSGGLLAEPRPLELDEASEDDATDLRPTSGPYLLTAYTSTLTEVQTGASITLSPSNGGVIDPDTVIQLFQDAGETDDPSGAGTVSDNPSPEPATTDPAPADDSTGTPSFLSVSGSDLAGGWTDLDADLYGEGVTALYGNGSGNDSGSITFEVAPGPHPPDDVTLELLALDDELAGSTTLSISLNGVEIYAGESGLPNWDPDATGNQWGNLTVSVPADTIVAGSNELVIVNTTPEGEVGVPPWVMIATVDITS